MKFLLGLLSKIPIVGKLIDLEHQYHVGTILAAAIIILQTISDTLAQIGQAGLAAKVLIVLAALNKIRGWIVQYLESR